MYTVKGKQGLSTQVYENGKTFTKTYEQLFNEHVYMPKRELMFQCLVKDSSDKTILTIEKEDMVSMNIEFDAVNGSKYQFGCLSCAKLNLQVKFSTVITKYSFLEPVIKLKVSYYYTASEKRNEWISVPLGRFIAYDIKSEYLTRTIQAYDTAYAYDEDEITSYPHYNLHTQTNEPHFKFSTSCKLRDIINYINTSTDFAKIRRRQGIDQYNGNYQYTTPIINVEKLGLNSYLDIIVYDLDANMTLRTFIGYLAGLQGKNAVFNRDGELEFRNPLEKARNFEYNGSHYGEYSEEDTQMKVSALQCTTVIGEDKEYTEEYNEEVQSKDENGNLIYDEEGNPVMETVTKQRNYMQFEVSDVTYVEGVTETTAPNDIYVFSNPLMNKDRLAQVLPKVKQTYLPCKFVMKGDPRLDINSTMVLKRRRKTLATDTSYVEEAITIPIMKMKMRLNNSCFLEIEAVADLEEKRSTTLAGSMSQRVGTLGKELTETTSMAKGMFMELYGSQASIGELFSEKAQLGTVVTNKITAAEAEFQNVIANDIEAGQGVIGTVVSNMISATDASIRNLVADEIKGVNATIENIDAKKVDTEYLFSEEAKINTAFIKDLDASTITTGSLDADKVNIHGQTPGIELNITGSTITMKTPHAQDEDEIVTRVLIGKENASSDRYVFEIRNALGELVWDTDTVKTSAIVNDSGDNTVNSVIDIPSLVTTINTDTSTDTQFLAKTIDVKTGLNETSGISMYKDLQTYLEELSTDNDDTNSEIINRIDTIDSEIDALNSFKTTAEETDADLKSRMSTAEGNIMNIIDYNLNNRVNSLEESIKELDLNSKVDKDAVINSINFSQEEELISGDKVLLSEFTPFNDFNKEEQITLGEYITEKDTVIQNLINDVSDKVNGIESEVNDSLANFDRDIADMDTKIENINTTLTHERTGLINRVAELEGTVEELLTRIAKLERHHPEE